MSNAHQILLVDDDTELRAVLTSNWVSTTDSRSEKPTPPRRPLRSSKAERVDCVVMDVGLPDMDGREAVKSCGRRFPQPNHHAHGAWRRRRHNSRARGRRQ